MKNLFIVGVRLSVVLVLGAAIYRRNQRFLESAVEKTKPVAAS